MAADVVILDSSVGALGAGAVVDEAQPVSIPAGASVTMIMANGETRLVEGPYSGPLAAATGRSGGAASALTASRGGETRVLGAVRAPKWELTE
ncbi:hypothetical protein G5B40_00545 [Pikeienuella piscinae]|uniref:Uncharacterized protein n=1 Tax=Pikeienuella piscinae TaxID=2748098 RepID=A0A7L5BWU0_9RHOB|nr:hypothetical protein [Pikeienuella piscinae]QIE54059.1 hypothetical protein G5B40_00545 [Pikeienuella piscinae]